MKKDGQDFIRLGECKGVHGIKGEFTFFLESGNDSTLKDSDEVKLVPLSPKSSLPKEGKLFSIDKIRFGSKIIVMLKGITDRSISEKMVPFEILFPRSKFDNELDEGEYYLVDLVGLSVFDFDKGEEIGHIESFYETAAQTVFVINLKNELVDLPFVEEFFPKVDLDEKRVYVRLPIYEE